MQSHKGILSVHNELHKERVLIKSSCALWALLYSVRSDCKFFVFLMICNIFGSWRNLFSSLNVRVNDNMCVYV